MLLIGVLAAFLGLEATSNLCGTDLEGKNGPLIADRFENIVESVAVRCFATDMSGDEVEELRINWLGAGGALAALLTTFLLAAGIARVLPPRPAFIGAAVSGLLGFVLVVLWFA